jgi:Ribosomal protein L7/L12
MAQKLILFEDILSGATIRSNKALMVELGKLAEHVFGEPDFSIEKAGGKADDIQIWSGDELYKAIANNYCTGFRFKSVFEIQLEGYAGPVMAWFFEPDGAFDDQIIVLTCESNGLFKNPRYVCGLLISEYDLDRLLGDLGGDQDDDEEDVAKANNSNKGGITLKLVSYSGSVIKMMTTLSSIDGIDEEAAFNILQKLPAVVKEGISAKEAMKIGAILEEAGATVELARASYPIVKTESAKPSKVIPKASPKPKSAPKPKTTQDPKSKPGGKAANAIASEITRSIMKSLLK